MDNLFYYESYLLDNKTTYELTEDELKLLDTCIFLVDNRCSLRVAARNNNYATTTLHRHIHNILPCLSYELYKCCVRIIKSNK